MKRKRYSEEKIISILKEHEAVASVPNICRHLISRLEYIGIF